jgi:hypothetical protein
VLAEQPKRLKVSQDALIKKMQAITAFCNASLKDDSLTISIIAYQLKELEKIQTAVASNQEPSNDFKLAYADCLSNLQSLKKRLENTIIID